MSKPTASEPAKPATTVPTPTPGRILLYRYAVTDDCSRDVIGQQRPAMVVRPNGDAFDVQVFTAGAYDFPDGCPSGGRGLHLVTARVGDAPGELSWPPRS